LVNRFVCALLSVCLIGPSLAAAQPPHPVKPPTPTIDRVTPSISTPAVTRIVPGPDYRLGPGDLLEVQVAGRTEVARHQVAVDLDGSINVPPLGPLEVGGLTLPEAYRRLVERARTMFRFVDVTLSIVAPRTFEIVLSGEVERPGTSLTSAMRRLQDVIAAAGGITPRGSVRRIRLSHKGSEREVDLLRFELTGDLAGNPLVEEGMRIHVPPRGPAVTLLGAVRRPGEYEMGATGSLAELLALTGGLQASAARGDARLTRLGAEGRKETVSLDLTTATTPPADVPLRSGDVLFVPTVSVLQDLVELRGAFVGTADTGKTTTAGKPTIVQRLELAQGERVRDVVMRAGGPAPFADLRLAVIERRGASGPLQRVPVDLHRLLVDKDETQNVALQNGDLLLLPVVEDRVYVVGEVKSPGAHDYRPDLTAREYVTLAGGPSNRAKVARTVVTFRNGRTYPMAEAPPLEPGAVVTVPEVAVKWWQDYALIAQVVASLVTAYTGLYLLFGGGSYVFEDDR
jgi:protein involved in polysaccharide export with SLBB domain